MNSLAPSFRPSITNSFRDEGTTRKGILWWFTLIAVGFTFFLIEHEFRYSEVILFDGPPEELDELISEGSFVRRLGYLSFAAAGVFACLLPVRRKLSLHWPLAWVIVGWLAICAGSVFWSDDISLSVRRLVVAGCCLVGATGIARHFSPRDLVAIVFGVTLTYLIVGIAAEISLGTFKLWSGDYRFAGTLHPNTQGINCSMLVLSAMALMRRSNWKLFGLLVVAAVGLGFLWITRSRTCAFGFMLAVGVVLLLQMQGLTRWVMLVGGTCLLLTVIIVDQISYQAGRQTAVNAALMGRSDEAHTLTGRIPLWTELLEYASRRPVLGYGFGAFWNERRSRDIAASQGWQIVHAHNSGVEMFINLGLVGLLGYVSIIVLGGLVATGRLLKTGNGGYRFLVGVLAFGFVNSMGDAYFALPSFCGVITATLLLSMTFTPAPSTPQLTSF